MALISAKDKAEAQHGGEPRLAQINKSGRFIITELGDLPLEPNAACLVLQLIPRCYQRGNVMLTFDGIVLASGEWCGGQTQWTALAFSANAYDASHPQKNADSRMAVWSPGGAPPCAV